MPSMEQGKMTISVITTFHKSGYDLYGKRMIKSFLENWPNTVKLYVYAEDCKVEESAPNLIIKDLHQSSPELVAFKTRWKNVPKANGDVSSDPIRSKRKDSGKGFKWHAIRFAHKVYSIFACAKECNTEWLMWMDADTYCHSSITEKGVYRMLPGKQDLCYLGRRGKYSECGLYAIHLTSQESQNFLKEFQRVYDDAEGTGGIFSMAEWHDSFVFDAVRVRLPGLKQHNWAATLDDLRPRPGMSKGEGHPLINCEWGAYLDHLKGGRKQLGKSKRDDLKVPRTEPYWQQFK
jgi:hypothetical protein